MSREALQLFISYAHEDDALRLKLNEHLALLKREGEVRAWDDREIGAGEEWRGQIDERLGSSELRRQLPLRRQREGEVSA